MKYPCKDCIVDVICKRYCEKLSSYILILNETDKEIPFEIISTPYRTIRAARCASHKLSTTRLFNDIIITYYSNLRKTGDQIK